MRKSRKERTLTVPVGIAIGCCTSLAVTLLGALFAAVLLNEDQMKMNSVGYFVMVVTLMSVAAGSVVSAKLVKRLKLPVGLASGAAYFLALLGITALFFEGQYQGVWVTVLLITGGSMSTLLIGLREKRTNTKRRKKMVNR